MAIVVHIPPPLQKFTQQQSAVATTGATIHDMLEQLGRDFPGLRAQLCDEQGVLRKFVNRNRSGCQNFMLAIKTSPVVPSGYGNASRITSRALGSDFARSPGLYSGAGSACGDHGCHGPYFTGAGPHITGTAAPNLAEFFTSLFERSATTQTSTPSSE